MTVLVTGATGTVGSHLVRELQARHMPARVFTRNPAQARALLGTGAETAVGDFADPASVTAAMTGIGQVYLASPNHPRQAAWEITVIDAAAMAGVRRIVKQSTIGAETGSECGFWDAHGRIESHLLAAPVPAVLVKANFFMSNLLASAETVRGAGAIYLPAAGAKVAMVDPRDVAAAAAAILAAGDARHDRRSYQLSGPDAVTFDDVAAALSTVTGRAIGFVPVPDQAARAQLAQAGWPDWYAANLVRLFGLLRGGAAANVTSDVHGLTGRQPRSITEFLTDHASAF